MSVEYDYDDGFIRLCNLIGGEEYTKISKALLNNPNSTDEEIAGGTGLKVNIVRKALYDLFGRSLITGIRVRDLNSLFLLVPFSLTVVIRYLSQNFL